MGVRVAASAVLVTAALLAGCGAGPMASTGRQANPSTSSAAPQSVSGICGPPDVRGRQVTLLTAAGVRLQAAEAGAGPRGVVMIPESGRLGMCGWWPYAAHLARSGYHVLIFDHRCTGSSSCPAGVPAQLDLMADIRAAVARLRRDGATRIVLAGASQGGSEAVIAASVPPRDVTAVVSLSADEITMPLAGGRYPRTAQAAVPRVSLPAFFAVASGDPYVTVPATRHLVVLTGSQVKRLTVLPAGSGHGWDLVTSMLPGPARSSFLRALMAFVRRATS